MPPDPTLDHLEKTFVEAYRKELDQEENVWRSLPFFAATLAMQVAALAQVRDWLAATAGWTSWAAAVVLVGAAFSTLAALFFLAWSILPAELRYVAREPDLLRYAEAVRARAEADGASAAAASEVARTALRATLVEQYALATDHNRGVNQRRASRRNRAGLATLCSVLLFVALVALAVVSAVTPLPPARSPASPHVPAGHADGAVVPRAAGGGRSATRVASPGVGRAGGSEAGPIPPDLAPDGRAQEAREPRSGGTGSVIRCSPAAPRALGPAPDQPRSPAPHAGAP